MDRYYDNPAKKQDEYYDSWTPVLDKYYDRCLAPSWGREADSKTLSRTKWAATAVWRLDRYYDSGG